MELHSGIIAMDLLLRPPLPLHRVGEEKDREAHKDIEGGRQEEEQEGEQ